MTQRTVLVDQFIQGIGWADANRNTVAGDASNRRYDRLTRSDNTTAILMDAPPDKGENVRPFMAITSYLLNQGISAPKIFEADPEHGFLLIEDLGDDLFARLMAQDPARQMPLYQAATDLLIHLNAAPAFDLPVCDANWLTNMTAPVFEWYAPQSDQDIQRRFRDIFHPLAQQLDVVQNVTILRDFHADNLLWLPAREGVAKVGVLDFQDALVGHPAYDLVSILQDARRDVPEEIEVQMITHYIAETGTDPTAFKSAYALLGAQRNLRILGIFARLCFQDGKAHYVDLIPRVWEYVMRNLADPGLEPLATLITQTLPAPTPSFLEHMKSQCKTAP